MLNKQKSLLKHRRTTWLESYISFCYVIGKRIVYCLSKHRKTPNFDCFALFPAVWFLLNPAQPYQPPLPFKRLALLEPERKITLKDNATIKKKGRPKPACHRLSSVKFEDSHSLFKSLRLLFQRFQQMCRGRGFLNECGVLPGNGIHLHDSNIDLLNTAALLIGGEINLRHQFGHLFNGSDNTLHAFARSLHPFAARLNLSRTAQSTP